MGGFWPILTHYNMRVPFDRRGEYSKNNKLVVHVDDIFAVGEKARCDEFGRKLNGMVPVKKPWGATLVFGEFL